MEKTVKVNGKEYYVNTTPDNRFMAEVYGVYHTEASGVVVSAFSELIGKPVMETHKTILDDDERDDVVVALGSGFSRSKKWQRTYDNAYGNWKKRSIW